MQKIHRQRWEIASVSMIKWRILKHEERHLLKNNAVLKVVHQFTQTIPSVEIRYTHGLSQSYIGKRNAFFNFRVLSPCQNKVKYLIQLSILHFCSHNYGSSAISNCFSNFNWRADQIHTVLLQKSFFLGAPKFAIWYFNLMKVHVSFNLAVGIIQNFWQTELLCN